ncbi:glutamate-cysteine ligase family protein [Porifericola rhodea]|uniref:glutamate-cysteine ligase family protein n=1 Tax=Porifericola rhodea TaxID=930972 RepID=UPI0026668C9B|nr:glutamate-cysteine ligase family protein [Porifericola rhodea]WKN30793.1 glutamate-cysteine ligase family protein [Porifericola rhodea]
MKDKSPLHLFQAYGVELEYMIVDSNTLDVKPIADELLKVAAGEYVNEFVNGSVTWSNELVSHVIELKCTEPVADLQELAQHFASNVVQINILLSQFDAKLMPTAAHPWMNPVEETQLWPYGNKDIYEAYDRIFGCSGHGWSNLQSTHLNLPFHGDEEFARLHAAIRILMPIMPALTASSPILEKKYEGWLDKRLDYYQQNQIKIPQITGKVIPEQSFSEASYSEMIYQPIEKAIRPYDEEGILEAMWLNSRGAIARFDRGSIEIRILDIQESPIADLAVLSLIIEVLKLLSSGKLASLEAQQSWTVEDLHKIYAKVIVEAQDAQIEDSSYLSLYQFEGDSASAQQLWIHLYKIAAADNPESLRPWMETLDPLLQRGSLASKILEVSEDIFSRENLSLIYSELCDCLDDNKTFQTCHIVGLS